MSRLTLLPLSDEERTMTSEEIRSEIREVLVAYAKLTVDISTLSDDADLFAAGMTSFASVNAMLGLEERFDVEFPDSMLNRSAFASIDAIASALEQIQTPA
jgi:acyl carrier protein